MDRLIQMGKDLGYEGVKLQDFVKGARESQKGNLKGIGSRRRKRKWWISSRRKKKIGKLS